MKTSHQPWTTYLWISFIKREIDDLIEAIRNYLGFWSHVAKPDPNWYSTLLGLSWQSFYQILFSNPFRLGSKNPGSLNFIRQIHRTPWAKFFHSTGLNGRHSIILEWYWRSFMQPQKNLSCPEWKQQAGDSACHVLECSVHSTSFIGQRNICFWELSMSVSLNYEPENEIPCLKTMFLLQKLYLKGSQSVRGRLA